MLLHTPPPAAFSPAPVGLSASWRWLWRWDRLHQPAANHVAPQGFVYERRQPELGTLHRAVRTGGPQVKALARERTGVSLPDFVVKAMAAYLACRQLPASFAYLSVLTAPTVYWPHHPKGEWGRVSVPARLLYVRSILAMTPANPFVRKPFPHLLQPVAGQSLTWPPFQGPARLTPLERKLDHKSLLKFHWPHSDLLAWVVMDELVQAAIGPQRLTSATAAG